MPYCKVGGTTIHYRIEGDGEALVLIHGVGSDLAAWDGVIAALRGQYRILRADLRGHGESEKTPGPYSLRMFSNDLLALLDHLSFAKTHLVGFSLGGLIAQQVAIEAYDRLLSLALISTIAGRSEEEKQRVAARVELLETEGAQAHLVAAGERWFSDGFRRANPKVIKKRKQKSLCNDPNCYVAAYRVLAENDLVDDLHKITTPTLVITGEFDAGSTPRMSNLIAQRVQHGEAIILPQLKHAVLLEAPTQTAARLEEFFASARN